MQLRATPIEKAYRQILKERLNTLDKKKASENSADMDKVVEFMYTSVYEHACNRS